MIDVLELPFDQYQRYRFAADLLEEVRPEGATWRILDVGGRTALLRSFLPRDRVALVDLEASPEAGLVLGDGARLLFAAFVWLTYMALEPFARRRWPDLLISWTRLLSGRLRDPLVGRDILIGVLAGASAGLLFFIQQSVPAFANLAAMTPIPPDFETLGTLRQLLSAIVTTFFFTTMPTLATMSLLVLLSVLLRRRWLAIAVSGLVLTLFFLGLSENLRADLPVTLLLGALMVFVAARFGILSLYATFLAVLLIVRFPHTLDFSRWYFGRSLFVLLIVVGLASGGFWIALGGKSPFGTLASDE